MTIAFPWPTYGIAKSSGASPIDGATVRIRDTTVDQGTVTGTTDADGKYVINIQAYATDGSTIEVWCAYGGEYRRSTFVLDVSHPGKQVDLTLEVIEYIESIALADSFTSNITRTLTESIDLFDNYTTTITREFTEAIALTDSIPSNLFTRTLTEAIDLTDDLTSIATLVKTLTESIALADSLDTATTLELTESITLTDSLTKVLTSTKTLTESIDLDDSIIRAAGLVKELTEAIDLDDSLTKGQVQEEVVCRRAFSAQQISGCQHR